MDIQLSKIRRSLLLILCTLRCNFEQTDRTHCFHLTAAPVALWAAGVTEAQPQVKPAVVRQEAWRF